MRSLFLFVVLIGSQLTFGQSPMVVYFFPGEGSDERIFSKIKLDSNFTIVHVTYPCPKKNSTMAQYAKLLSSQIDTSRPYSFIGVSFGGMLCSELAEFLHPDKIIIISSAKCRNELPLLYRFQKTIPINKLVPKGIIKLGAQILQPIVEPDRRKEKKEFKSMLKSKTPTYYKRSVDMIINWDRTKINSSIIHIHGTNDHTLPAKNLKADFEIKDGSHMMTLTRGEEINGLILLIIAR